MKNQKWYVYSDKYYLRIKESIYSLVKNQKDCSLFDTEIEAIIAARRLNRLQGAINAKVYLVSNHNKLVWEEISENN